MSWRITIKPIDPTFKQHSKEGHATYFTKFNPPPPLWWVNLNVSLVRWWSLLKSQSNGARLSDLFWGDAALPSTIKYCYRNIHFPLASSSCGVVKEKGHFCSHFGICTDTVCLFPENYTSFEYFLQVKMFFLILCYLIYFDQGKSRCPGASCLLYFTT